MNTRHTYTILSPERSLISSRRDNMIARTNRYYYNSNKMLLAVCKRLFALSGRKVFVAVHEYTDFRKGHAGRGKLVDFATYTEKDGFVMHGLTPRREAQLRRYIPQAA